VSLKLVLVPCLSFVVLFASFAVEAKKHNGDFGTPREAPKHVPKQAPKPALKPAPKKSVQRPQPQKPVVAPVLPPAKSADGFLSPDDFAREWISGNSNGKPEVPNVQDDSELVYAVQNRRDLLFVQGANVTVLQIMPDDNDGLRHQRWYVKLSSGESVFAVYNIDITARVPIEVNQKMKLGGEFKWTNQGALIHWLHEDPKERRPDGYVEVGGRRYGQVK